MWKRIRSKVPDPRFQVGPNDTQLSRSRLSALEADKTAAQALASDTLGREEAERLAASMGDPAVLETLLQSAAESKRRGKGALVSVSKNIFIG